MSYTVLTSKVVRGNLSSCYHVHMSKKVDYKAQLRRLYTGSAVGYVGLAILAGVFMSNITYQLTTGHLAKDELASQKSVVLVPASHAVYDAPLKWTLVIILLLSAVIPLLNITRLKKVYEKGLKKRVMPWRWVDMGIITALMIEVIALLSGLQDIFMLKILAGLMVITCVLGWLAERAANDGKKLVKPIFVIGLVTGLLPWLIIAAYAVATPFYAAVRAPWYVYALYASLLGSFVLFALNQWRQHQKFKQWKDYLFVERNYVVISLVAKVAFAVILIVGLKK